MATGPLLINQPAALAPALNLATSPLVAVIQVSDEVEND